MQNTNSGIYFLGDLFLKGSAFISIFILTRGLGDDTFGDYSVLITIANFLGPFSLLGLPTYVIRNKFNDEMIKGVYYSYVLFGSLFIILAVGILLSSGSFFLGNNIKVVNANLLLISVLSFITGIFNISKAFYIADSKALIVRSMDLFIVGVNIVFYALFYFTERLTLTYVIGVQIFSLSISLLYSYHKKVIVFERVRFFQILPRLFKIISNSIPFFVAVLNYQLVNQVCRFIIASKQNSIEVGRFFILFKVSFVMSSVHNSSVSSFMPIASKAYQEGNITNLRIAFFKAQNFSYVLVFILGSMLIILAREILSLFGDAYVVTHVVQSLRLIVLGIIFSSSVGPSGALLQMTKYKKMEIINGLLLLIITGVISWFLVDYYGILGAAIGMLTAFFLTNLIQVFEIRFFFNFWAINWTRLLVICLMAANIFTSLCLEHDFIIYEVSISVIFLIVEKKLINEFYNAAIKKVNTIF